jgi:hypothetical protein
VPAELVIRTENRHPLHVGMHIYLGIKKFSQCYVITLFLKQGDQMRLRKVAQNVAQSIFL